MIVPHSHTRSCREAGKIIIELILAIPILLMIPAGVMEYARFVRFDQIAVVFSQEAASRAYRRCGDFYELTPWTDAKNAGKLDIALIKQRTQLCLAEVQRETNVALQQFLPGSQVILSAFRVNADGKSPKIITALAVSPTQLHETDPYRKTSYAVAGGGTTIDRIQPSPGVSIVLAATAERRERLVVAEVTFRYETVIPIYQAFFNSASIVTNGVFRETTIL